MTNGLMLSVTDFSALPRWYVDLVCPWLMPKCVFLCVDRTFHRKFQIFPEIFNDFRNIDHILIDLICSFFFCFIFKEILETFHYIELPN